MSVAVFWTEQSVAGSGTVPSGIVDWYRVLLVVGRYRVLLVVGRYIVTYWADTEFCWQQESTERHCGLVHSLAGSGTVQSGIVDWYIALLVMGLYRVALWADTECCWQ